jgi:hypothetical protein
MLNINKMCSNASEIFSTVVSSRAVFCSENTLESRDEYSTLIEYDDGKARLEKQIVLPALNKLGIAMTKSIPIKIRVINMSTMDHMDYVKTDTFTVGRYPINDIIINAPFNAISRIHFIAFCANNKIVIMDTWSLNGTSTVNNSTKEKVVSTIGKRKMISFDIGVRFMIKIENYTLIFNQDMKSTNSKDCIVCCENPRNMRFNCGHSSTCEECTKIIMANTNRCPICKQQISGTRASEAFCTFTVND